MDKMREEFEEWYLSQVADDDVVHIDLWSAWQASRASLCVELPRCWNDEQRDYRDDLVKSTDQAGVSYK